jgi:hypothetical protein
LRSVLRSLAFLAGFQAQLAPQPASEGLPSSVIVPDGKKLHSLAVPGSHQVLRRGQATHLVEVRGWLRAVDPSCKAKDPAWYYLLEPDPEWADSVGISLADILRVGNITGLERQTEGGSVYQIVAPPLIRMEFGGWDSRKRDAPPPPSWRFQGAAGCPDVFFAFDPLRPVPSGPRLRPGSYVRVVGSIVTDAPHAGEAVLGAWLVQNFGIALTLGHLVDAAQDLWSEGGEENPLNPGRWTEIHPPDQIEPLSNRDPTETVRGVAICVRDGMFPKATEPLTLTLSPPGARPSWARGARVVEVILANFPKVAFSRSVAITRVRIDRDAAHIRVDPRSEGVTKFAAIYRISWSPGGPSWIVRKPRDLRHSSRQ